MTCRQGLETPMSQRNQTEGLSLSETKGNKEGYNRTQELIKMEANKGDLRNSEVNNSSLVDKYNNYSGGDLKLVEDQGLNARFIDKTMDYKK